MHEITAEIVPNSHDFQDQIYKLNQSSAYMHVCNKSVLCTISDTFLRAIDNKCSKKISKYIMGFDSFLKIHYKNLINHFKYKKDWKTFVAFAVIG